MHLKVFYNEINSFITRKLQQPIRVQYGGNGAISLNYTCKKKVAIIGEIKKDILISLSVHSVSSDRIVLRADSGAVVGFFLPTVIESVASSNNLDFLSMSGDKIKIRLDRIPEVPSVLEKVSLSDVKIESDGVDVQVTLK